MVVTPHYPLCHHYRCYMGRCGRYGVNNSMGHRPHFLEQIGVML